MNFLEAAKAKYKRISEDKTDENDSNSKRRKVDVTVKEEKEDVKSVNGEG